MTSSSHREIQELEAEQRRISSRLAHLKSTHNSLGSPPSAPVSVPRPAGFVHYEDFERLTHHDELLLGGMPLPDNMAGPPMKRAKTVTQTLRQRPLTASNMVRSSSSRSARSHLPAAAIPFSGSGHIKPLSLDMASQHAPAAAAMDFQLQLDASGHGMVRAAGELPPGNPTPLAAQPLRRPPPPLQTLDEGGYMGLNVGQDIDQFLASRCHNTPASPFSGSVSGSPQYHHSQLGPFQQPLHTPSTPFSSAPGSLTDAPTFGTPMSRETSSAVPDSMSISGTIEMMRLSSQGSNHAGSSWNRLHQSSLGKRASQSEQDIFGIGSSIPQTLSYPVTGPGSFLSRPSAPLGSSDSSTDYLGGDDATEPCRPDVELDALVDAGFLDAHTSMERSASNTSIKSTSSLKVRAKQALSRQNINATRAPVLQPRPATALSDTRHEAKPKSNKDGKKEISRPKYERPKHPKVYCNRCDENAEGFRGDHELRRHMDARHKKTVKKWVCRDPATVDIESTVQAVKPLSKCKQCRAGKQYGAYYNAAAHLRRTHFKKRPIRKNANRTRKSDPDEEKRGGKGGGDWPSMAELKNWFYELEVSVDEDAAEDGDLDAEDDVSGGNDESPVAPVELGLSPEYPPRVISAYDPAVFESLSGHCPADANMLGTYSVSNHQLLVGFSLAELDRGRTSASSAVGHMPISSAGFYDPQSQFSQIMATTGHADYGSPVESSNATITQASIYTHDALYTTGHSQEFDFDAVFDPMGNSI